MSRDALAEPWTLSFPYTRTTGPVLGRFFAGLAERRILGRRARDGHVFVPPLEYDPRTAEPLGDWVELSCLGTVQSYTWIARPLPSHPRSVPFAYALVLLDGADSALTHIVDAEREEDVRCGLRVCARWSREPVGHILDLHGFSAARADDAFTPRGDTLPPLASRSFTFPMALHYDVRAGFALSEHLRGLSEGHFVGRRCARCARVMIPPLGACSVCAVAAEESVALPDTGVVTTFCIVNLPVRGQEQLARPFACANVLLDGADTPFLALIQGCAPHDVRRGMPVRAVWRPPGERGPSLASVSHFTPTGEPPVDLDALIARRKESFRA